MTRSIDRDGRRPSTPERDPPPLVVGGTGGSGTRVITRILMYAGRYMGALRNEYEDALEFEAFDYRWAPTWLAARAKGIELSDDQQVAMRAEFAAARDRHRAPMADPTAPWGWKHSPSVHLLPFLDQVYPRLRFIHVIRDGRDFAFGRAGGYAHTAALAHSVVDGNPAPVAAQTRTPVGGIEVTPLRKALFWARVHTECADYGEARLGSRYLRVRLEDLCAQPDPLLRRLFAFAEAGGAEPDGIRNEIETPASIGTWQRRDPAEVESVVAAAQEALKRFGYVDGP